MFDAKILGIYSSNPYPMQPNAEFDLKPSKTHVTHTRHPYATRFWKNDKFFFINFQTTLIDISFS
jgi:hypothetical protein